MPMDTQTVRWFQQVADGATVTEVSEIERTTQSGVSRALARLEVEVGTPLLRRSGRRLRMTAAGAAFKHHADVMVHALDDGLAAVEQLLDPESGLVTLAYQPSLGTWLVPALVGAFRTGHPDVRFDLRPKRDELVPAVGPGADVDLEMSTLRPGDPVLRWQRLDAEPLHLAVPPGHRLSGSRRLRLADARDEPFMVIRPTSLLRGQCDALCAAAGFAPRVAFECDDLPTMRGFVVAGLGVAILPASGATGAALAGTGSGLLALDDPGASREIGLTWSAARRLLPAARLFRDHVLARRET